jgi:hypothetical protein
VPLELEEIDPQYDTAYGPVMCRLVALCKLIPDEDVYDFGASILPDNEDAFDEALQRLEEAVEFYEAIYVHGEPCGHAFCRATRKAASNVDG